MSLRILVIPDKFKGTISAREAARAIARGWRSARPHDRLDLLPMSDGGDGFGEITSSLLGAKPYRVNTVDAAHRKLTATWWWEPNTKTAIIESANVVGLTILPPGKFHPFELDTFGLGAVLRAVQHKGAKQILIGIGGSATNDGGFGLAHALGWEFLDHCDRPLRHWTELHSLAKIHPPNQRYGKVIVAVDVRNPLLGAHGATRVFGPQKGLRTGELAVAERNLRRLARVAKQQFGHDRTNQPGAGAAGGLGFGLAALLGARLESGFDLFAHYAKLARRLRKVDLVITGEGSIDRSTMMGKGVGQIVTHCQAGRIPCLGLAGGILGLRATKQWFKGLYALTDLTTATQAKAKPAFWLERLVAKAANGWHDTD